MSDPLIVVLFYTFGVSDVSAAIFLERSTIITFSVVFSLLVMEHPIFGRLLLHKCNEGITYLYRRSDAPQLPCLLRGKGTIPMITMKQTQGTVRGLCRKITLYI